MRISHLTESSGYSLRDSIAPHLTYSKAWLISELEQISTDYSTIYCLGSWFCNVSLYMHLMSDIHYNKFINVEQNAQMLKVGKKLNDLANVPRVQYMLKNANTLDYRQLGDNGLVINCSLVDMAGTTWFENIPKGTLVAMQARDHDPGNKFESADDIVQKFPVKVLYQGTKSMNDGEVDFNRFMVIGRK